MGEYVYALMLVGVSAAMVELLSLGGEGSRMRGHLKLVAGLCVLVACIRPMQEGVVYLKELVNRDTSMLLPQEQPGGEAYRHIWDDYMGDMSCQEVRAWTQTTLHEVFSISAEESEVEVTIEMREGVPYLSDVYISLWGKAILKNPHQIEMHISSALGCPCYVYVQKGGIP